MEDLKTELAQLDGRQRDYVVARAKTNSASAALKDAGIPAPTFYGWDKELRDKLNDIAQRFKTEVAYSVLVILQDGAKEAASVTVGLLKSRNESVRLRAAQVILEWVIGKPAQVVDVSATTDTKIIIDTNEILDTKPIDFM